MYLPLGTDSQNASFRNGDLPLCDKEPGDPGLGRQELPPLVPNGWWCALPHRAGPPALWALPHAFFKLSASTFILLSSFPGKPSNGEAGGTLFVDLRVEKWGGVRRKLF